MTNLKLSFEICKKGSDIKIAEEIINSQKPTKKQQNIKNKPHSCSSPFEWWKKDHVEYA